MRLLTFLLLALFSLPGLGLAAELAACHQNYGSLVQGSSDQRLAVAPALPRNAVERESYGKFLNEWLGLDPATVTYDRKYPMVVRGKPERNFFPEIDVTKAVTDKETYDAVIVGGGPGGLTAGTYLTEAGKKVLILEQGKELGGLAVGDLRRGVQYGRGGAYFSAVDGDLFHIYQHLGLARYKKKYAIPEHIDSYFWNGKYYPGLWESKEALAELPASFSLFKYALEHALEEGKVLSTPFRGRALRELDSQSMSEWVRKMPAHLKELADRGDKKAARLLARFESDPKVVREAPMEDVLGILQLYGRSALGDHPDKVSAQAFASFYSSELETRYSSNLGAGAISEAAVQKLQKHKKLVQVKTEASVGRVENTPEGVAVYYVENGETRRVNAKRAVLGTPLNVTNHILAGYAELAPEAQKIAASVEHRNYMVVNVHVKGHPWKDTYDLWVRNDATYSQNALTDIIDGRWMDYAHLGHNKPRPDDRGVITIYKPLPAEHVGTGFGAEDSTRLAEDAVDSMRATLKEAQGAAGVPEEEIEVLAAEVNRWPFSIHLAAPGYLQRAEVLEKPVGNVYLANNNMGVPAVEEAVYRGYVAAQNILKADPPVATKPKAKAQRPSAPATTPTPRPGPALNP